MAKECTLSTGKLPLGGLPRNSVVRITDHPNMTSAVYCGCKAINQTNKKGILCIFFLNLKLAVITLKFEQKYLSRVMRKPTICICEIKDADQLRGNREADQRLCFRYTDSTIPLLSKSEISSL